MGFEGVIAGSFEVFGVEGGAGGVGIIGGGSGLGRGEARTSGFVNGFGGAGFGDGGGLSGFVS